MKQPIFSNLVHLSSLFLVNSALAQEQPNIIVVLADDLGWSDTSNTRTNLDNPSDFYETPSLDQMAEEGMAFNNAYVNGPNCAPARAAILSGQYAPRPTNNVFLVGSLNRGGNNTRLVGPAQGLPSGQDAIPATSITMAEALKAGGYVTAYVGKFHVTESAAEVEEGHGFDYNFGGRNSGGPGNYHARNGTFGPDIEDSLDAFAADYTQAYVDQNIKPFSEGVSEEAIDALVGTDKHATDAVTDAAISFLTEEADSPMFLFLGHYAVHGPTGVRQARRDLLTKYQNKDNSGLNDTDEPFGALIEGMDQAIGRLLRFLETTDDPRNPGQALADNTIVVFLSDNGGRETRSNNGPLKGQKGELKEGGIRVPMIVWSANENLVNGGIINSTPVSGVDLYTTFLELANAPQPDNYPLDGRDLADLFLNTPAANEALAERSIFWHVPGYLINDGRDLRPQSIVRRGDFKLIYNYETELHSMYNLTDDIGEQNDLLASSPNQNTRRRANDLARRLRSWVLRLEAPLPSVRATGDLVSVPPRRARLP